MRSYSMSDILFGMCGGMLLARGIDGLWAATHPLASLAQLVIVEDNCSTERTHLTATHIVRFLEPATAEAYVEQRARERGRNGGNK